MATNNAVNTSLSGQTGTGNFVGATSPSLVTPALGTPSSGTLTNCTGLPPSGLSGLGTGVATALGQNVTGSGGIALATSPSLTTPTIGAASATSITFSSTTGIVGTTTNNNAAAGSVGEYISSVISAASAVPLTTVTAANVTSLSLTAGDWDVFGNVTISSSATGLLNGYGWISLTSATLPDASLVSGSYVSPAVTAQIAVSVPFVRVSIASTTTVYLSAVSQFGVGTASACGGIYARRSR